MKFHILVPAALVRPLVRYGRALRSLGYLLVRLDIAWIFFKSGLSKITYWPGTVMTFKDQYHVPLMSPVFAAYLGTGLEFLLPVLLVLGLGGRISIFCFFIYNIICVISFHFLWTPAGSVGLIDHLNWGLLLLLILFHGSGRLSLDHLIHKKYGYLLQASTWQAAKDQFHRHHKQ